LRLNIISYFSSNEPFYSLVNDAIPLVPDEVEGEVPADVVRRDSGDDATAVGLANAATVGQRPVQIPVIDKRTKLPCCRSWD